MEDESGLSSLLQSLKVGDPCLPPKTWESISTESGTAAAAASSPVSSLGSDPDPIYEPSSISESVLVRLVINALQGNKAALDDIEKLSEAFCCTPADRTLHRVPSLWHRTSSTSALGKILKSFGIAGHIFLFLNKFVDYFLSAPLIANGQNSERNANIGTEMGIDYAESNPTLPTGEFQHKFWREGQPHYTLVNQAFAVAVKKVLEGYICSLNTLSASVKLRRSMKSADEPVDNSLVLGSLTSTVHSEITILEVYLHTKELRTRIESLGNICCLRREDLFISVSSGKSLDDNSNSGFDYFPRGGDLLTYLYVQLRDSDLVHHGLLKFLVTRSFEPYYGFIKSWIFKAQVDDPHEEFIVEVSGISSSSSGRLGYNDDFLVDSIKEREGVSVPCFLEDVCLPLLRAGQQLQVLIKLLDLCNFSLTEDHSDGGAPMPSNMASFEDLFPCWNASSGDALSCLSSLSFCKDDIRDMMIKRETKYKTLMEKLKIFFKGLSGRSQLIKSLVKSCDLQSRLGQRSHENCPASILLDEGLSFSYTINQETTNMDAGFESSTSDDSSYEMEPLQLSESSSFSSFEEESESEEASELHDIDLYTSRLSKSYAYENGLERSSLSEKSSAPGFVIQKMFNEINQITSTGKDIENEKINRVSVSDFLLSRQNTSARTSDIFDDAYISGRCWPLGGLLKNPLLAETNFRGQKELHFTECNLTLSDEDMGTLEREVSYFGEMFVPDNSELKPADQVKLKSESCRTLSLSGIHHPWMSQSYYDLNTNPMLTKATWLRAMCNPVDKNFAANGRTHSYFDFSSVKDPYKIFLERLNIISSCDPGPALGGSDFCGVEISECVDGSDPINPADQSDFVSPSCSSSHSKDSQNERDFSQCVSGGANWERLLRYSGESSTKNSRYTRCASLTLSEIPLDVIIDRCILQEILLQYKYVSDFTIKFLEEGFVLHEHLSALRRYHFMEVADWADSFILSLWNHKWYVTESNQRISEIQSLLDLALQGSSCESDPYRERLFIHTKEQSVMPLSTAAIGAFNFVLLGYKVDWPVSIVVSSEALNIYSNIFSFLVQVRLAVFSLTDLWYKLKALVHAKNHGQSFGAKTMENFNNFIQIRLQVNHFVSTLQRYVQSQLSDVSWCKFLHSLKHQVKDMMDLESVHMSYLADALHICFLSIETQTIASIIKSILQCALDFSSCIIGGGREVQSGDLLDSTSLHAWINFSQVLAIKATFERNLKDLYLCYLKSPKHGEFGLCRFWGYLNYNDYYSNIMVR